MAQKIATCCYCGMRAALRLDAARHELACANCGAPLHEMKALRTGHEEVRRKGLVAPSPVRGTAGRRGAPVPGGEALIGALGAAALAATSGGRRKKGKRKSLSRRLFAEAFDAIEDIFD